MNPLVIQMVGFLGMALCIGSYQIKSGRGLILCKTAGDLVYVIHYLMLGAYSGCVTLFVGAVSQLACSCRGRYRWAEWKGWKWLFSGLLLAACAVVWRNDFRPVPSLCAAISMTSVILATWSGDPKVIRYGKLFVAGPAWLLYSVIVGSWSGILCELIGMASAAIAVFRYRQNAVTKTQV